MKEKKSRGWIEVVITFGVIAIILYGVLFGGN